MRFRGTHALRHSPKSMGYTIVAPNAPAMPRVTVIKDARPTALVTYPLVRNYMLNVEHLARATQKRLGRHLPHEAPSI